MNDDSAKGDVTSSDVQEQHHIILFYKYTKFPAISDQSDLNEKYRAAMEVLCQRLGLCGRVLIGYDYDSNEGDPTKYCEGINGTLSGDYWAIICYCTAMMGRQKQGTYYYVYDDSKACDKDLKADHRSAVKEFWDECDFLVVEDQTIVDERNVFTMMDWEDFKFSTHTFLHEERSQKMFPDCKISVVKEIINTGGKLDGITMEDVGQVRNNFVCGYTLFSLLVYFKGMHVHAGFFHRFNNNCSSCYTNLTGTIGTHVLTTYHVV